MKETIVHGDLEVKGKKIGSIDSKVNTRGYLKDQWGNKIFRTDSEANKKRLEKLEAKKAKKSSKKVKK